MPPPLEDLFGDLTREEVVRKREAIEVKLAAWRQVMGQDVAIWPADAREEYADMAQTWCWLGLYRDELDERRARAG